MRQMPPCPPPRPCVEEPAARYAVSFARSVQLLHRKYNKKRESAGVSQDRSFTELNRPRDSQSSSDLRVILKPVLLVEAQGRGIRRFFVWRDRVHHEPVKTEILDVPAENPP